MDAHTHSVDVGILGSSPPPTGVSAPAIEPRDPAGVDDGFPEMACTHSPLVWRFYSRFRF